MIGVFAVVIVVAVVVMMRQKYKIRIYILPLMWSNTQIANIVWHNALSEIMQFYLNVEEIERKRNMDG